jgi:hypothetical protein
MTGAQIYALYVAPLLLLAAGAGLYFLTGWLHRREQRRERFPAE